MEALLMRWLCPHTQGTGVSTAPSRSAQTVPTRASAQRLAVIFPMAASWTAWPSFGINLGIKYSRRLSSATDNYSELLFWLGLELKLVELTGLVLVLSPK